tara:strand:- start:5438 stop:6487 length:1050 start_codon:yes stop_codon:yes gene_type:complete
MPTILSIKLPSKNLLSLAQEIFERSGLSGDHAQKQAEILVWANLRGIDSHGVLRIPRYLDLLQNKEMNAKPNISIVNETTASTVIDGDQAPGVIAMRFGMEQAINKAKSAGIGWTLIGKTTHSGPLGYYTQIAIKKDMIGIAIMTSRPNMAYHGSKTAGIATSPISIGVPGGSDGSLILDMSTSAITRGKIKEAIARGLSLPENTAITDSGEPTTDPTLAKIPMPLGGPKGSGLSLMFETLTSLLMGLPLLEPALAGREKKHSQNGLAIAININDFITAQKYKDLVTALSIQLKKLPALDTYNSVLLPGESGQRTLEERQKNGIPLPDKTWQELSLVANKLNITMPNLS